MKIELPDPSLVVLVGASGSGKSTFARRHFLPTEVLGSDACRGLVCDDETDPSATPDAFEVLAFVAGKRLARGRLTVIDATNVRADARRPWIALARAHHLLPVAVVLDVEPGLCVERNRARAGRSVPRRAVRTQHHELRRSVGRLRREGFRRVFRLRGAAAVEAAEVIRTPLWCDRRGERGPFDIIGDVHGCYDELAELLGRLGYELSGTPQAPEVRPPAGRRVVFLGDLVDRGPGVVPVLRLVLHMVRAGSALCLPGNHEVKLARALRGRRVKVAHGLAESLEQLAAEPEAFRREVAEFIDGLVSHYVLDEGRLVVAHAGLREDLQGRASGAVRSFCLYGETSGEVDEYGLPVRHDWAARYRGSAQVVYGHTPVPEARWVNRTLCLDTGCVFGGALSALRYPEGEIVSVPARRVYCAPQRPLAAGPSCSAPEDLDASDVLGERVVETRLVSRVVVRAEQAAAALDVLGRFAADPRWLIYLPPTMSPPDACPDGPFLEHPEQAFAYYARAGVRRVVCEEKHMGSRAVVVLCREPAVARRRFRIESPQGGVVFSRTGRPFFADPRAEAVVLDRLRDAFGAAGLWEELDTDWACLDGELLPWSYKAGALVRGQYAAVEAAGDAALARSVAALEAASARGAGDEELLARLAERRRLVGAYGAAWRRHCRPVRTPEDLVLAPFHLLAVEGCVLLGESHDGQLATLARLADGRGIVETPHLLVDLDDPTARADAVRWWEERTAAGGEGMVVKPLESVHRGRRGLAQPALKVRGREYLRLVYGPEYTLPEHLERLRRRSVSRKRSLALREFALGLEALERFVAGEPLHRVHECVLGVLALESEPVDSRL
ncbi:MAG: polynucleotide kinase-phosphatase [Planctomycetota bacterium]|nr:MAG: polynucleotide kinase-phosphatase [Planctomycetota bacterium]